MAFHFIIFSCLILFLILWSKLFVANIRRTKSPILKITFCIICVLIFKCDFGIHFLGLEYEDAYSFSAYTRQLSYGITSDSLRIQCIDIGSLADPQSLGTYGGHYITYPIFLYIFTALFGFSFTTISLTNSFISFLSLITLAFYNYKNRFGWIVATFLFCLAPAINLFSTCFLSESFSSLLCLCFVLAYYEHRKNNSISLNLFVFISFFLGILTKRDNTILILVPAIFSIHAIFNKNYRLAIDYFFPYCAILILTSLFIHNIFLAEIEESADISQSTFSVQIFLAQFPVYIKSLCSFSYFSICIFLFLALALFNIIQRKFTIKLVCLASLFFASLLMYSSHYRGYYFVENLESFNEFATFRYINNFFWILPIFIALSFKAPHKYNGAIFTCLSLIGTISAYLTANLRINSNQEECKLRFNDVEIVNKTLNSNDVIITDVPLVFLNVISPETYVCNIQRISNINFNSSHKFYIFTDDLSVLDSRYNLNLSIIDKQLIMTFPSKKKLYLVNSVVTPSLVLKHS